MALLITVTLSLLLPATAWVVYSLMSNNQRKTDADRVSYSATFPANVSPDSISSFIETLSGPLATGLLGPTPSIAFETRATDRGITIGVMLPKHVADHIESQARAKIPGLNLARDEERVARFFDAALEIGMHSPSRPIKANAKGLSTSILASIQALLPGEEVVVQWVIAAKKSEPMPAKDANKTTNEFSVKQALIGTRDAGGDELNERREKLGSTNFLAIGRIGSIAPTVERAERLALNTFSSMSSSNTHANYLKKRRGNLAVISDQINRAATPPIFPAQLAVGELVGLISWPIDSPFISGLPHAGVRLIAAGENIPREGRVIGTSNYPGHKRTIAMDYEFAVHHTYIGGMAGTGKTSLLAELARQDMENGYGVICVDMNNTGSTETLANRILDFVPAHRIDDTIIIRPAANLGAAVGFNLLDQGNPETVARDIEALMTALYSDVQGVNMRKLLFYGVQTLAEAGGYTLNDLPYLVAPDGDDQTAWAHQLMDNAKDADLQRFWSMWKTKKKDDQLREASPLLNRFWQLTARPEARDLFGQTESAFTMDDVVMQNKILIIDLAGVSSDTALPMATLLINALWTSVNRNRPEKANFLFLDELQLIAKLPVAVDDMFRRARQMNLGVNAATQYLQGLDQQVKAAIPNTVRNRVIFRSGNDEARLWRDEMDRSLVGETDLQSNEPFEAYAQLSTRTGRPSPISIHAHTPSKPTGTRERVLRHSETRYLKSSEAILREGIARRTAKIAHGPAKAGVKIGVDPTKPWKG
ncbi:hypothetical protein [Rathayibacter festucae]|uniref:Type IV secretion system coupling protein TraD DNA-binding domain-containing protein n=1 Tax=Rathayibacter festucae DSM 15932 TaxID=1328866 RepID=A0A3Q9UQ11_9MICO|nr:hypothetical protein [Rathayibacter festucae]AZZ51438.1 hypothetical protein C1I64_04865 [Rathayibacter festucae DSM 15932]